PLLLRFYRAGALAALHSFPTRRSSDLVEVEEEEPRPQPEAERMDELGGVEGLVAHGAPAEPHHQAGADEAEVGQEDHVEVDLVADRKSTRLNSSHVKISYAVFCLKKKK